MLRHVFFGFWVAVLLGMAAPQVAFAQSDEAEPVEDYVLTPGDIVEISVLEDSSLNRQVLVRPDGKISLPLAGTLVAAERTPEALQAAIRDRLAKDFIEPPTVTVSLVNTATATEEEEFQLIYVIGQVANPGRFEIVDPVNILQALAIAGGPGVFAATTRIQLRQRDENGGETVILFDYDQVLEGGGTRLLVVDDGDVVVVPERGLFE
ncbi:MAG: polysaccharide biosynthesis/export family protein [Pseudomonadota bacterium]